jgi:uncharacterized protein YecE (DUF72 family)
MVNRDRLHIGTSGWSYGHWKSVFYPENMPRKDWLEFYQRHFTTVEVNASFYRLPTETTFRNWRDRSEPGFRFSLKGSRLVTHLKRLRDVKDNLEAFCGRARLLEEHLGPLLWQLPPGMEKDIELLGQFLQLLPAGLTHAVEFRNPHWYADDTFELLRRSGPVVLCQHDMKGSESPPLTTAPSVYIRFHGPSGNYTGNYSCEQLAAWADRITQYVNDGAEVWVYFNNDIGGCAITDARRLRGMVSGGA